LLVEHPGQINNEVYEYLVSYAVEKKLIILSSHYIITYTFAHAIMSHTVEQVMSPDLAQLSCSANGNRAIAYI
jgi:hypothetical protein